MKLSIIIPVYNEEQTINELVERVRAVDLGDVEKEIMIANDGSNVCLGRKAPERADGRTKLPPASAARSHSQDRLNQGGRDSRVAFGGWVHGVS